MRADPHILHVFSSAGLYGAEHAVLGLIRALADAGIQGTLACIDNPHLEEQPLYERARVLGIPAERIPCSGRLDGATIRALRAMLARHPCPLLHVHGYKSAFYALRARRSFPGAPIVATVHGWVTNTRSLWLYRLLELHMLRHVQGVCIVAEGMRQPLLDAGIRSGRIRLIENGIDTARFRADGPAATRAEFGIPDPAFVFGGVMRLSSEKNPLGLLEAFAQVARAGPTAWLVLAGDGPQRAELERRARDLGIAGRVCLLGARNDPERLYPLFDCFVLPSLTEGLPLALLEAMACERPVIASRVGQVAAVLEGLPATLVPAGDSQLLAGAMQNALRVRQTAAPLRQRVRAGYSVERMARDYAEVYRGLGNRHVDHAA
ncbi:MAG TPA: glycosyltransferase [Rhodanobacteraceae bacterium]|nr:glycosyltransferase [Rhodanobacteraceae bacterium]